MRIFTKKFSILFLAVFTLTAVFFSEFAQASFWDTIRAWVTINPLFVDVSAPAEVEVDKVFKVEAKIINKGEEKIENSEAEIFLPEDPEGLVLIQKDPVKKIGVIPGKKEKKISWSVKGEELGNYGISVKVSGVLQGKELSKESDTIMVKIIKKTVPGGGKASFNLFQRFFNLFQEWFKF